MTHAEILELPVVGRTLGAEPIRSIDLMARYETLAR